MNTDPDPSLRNLESELEIVPQRSDSEHYTEARTATAPSRYTHEGEQSTRMESPSCGDWEGVPPGLPVREGVIVCWELKHERAH